MSADAERDPQHLIRAAAAAEAERLAYFRESSARLLELADQRDEALRALLAGGMGVSEAAQATGIRPQDVYRASHRAGAATAAPSTTAPLT